MLKVGQEDQDSFFSGDALSALKDNFSLLQQPHQRAVFVEPTLPKSSIGKTALPQKFIPGPHTVICGRGNACTKSAGNIKLRKLIDSYLQKYSQAKSKLEKTGIVSSILDSVKQSNPNGGSFVKFDGGLWWEVEDGVAREKVGCLFRDALHSKYRSSTKAKLARRKALSKNSKSNDVKYTMKNNDKSQGNTIDDVDLEPLPFGSTLNVFPTTSFSFPSNTIVNQGPQEKFDNIKMKTQFLNASSASFHNINESINLRDVTPISTHLDILGSVATLRNTTATTMTRNVNCNSTIDGPFSQKKFVSLTTSMQAQKPSFIFNALDEACMLTADTEVEELGLPDDISIICEEDHAVDNTELDLSNLFD